GLRTPRTSRRRWVEVKRVPRALYRDPSCEPEPTGALTGHQEHANLLQLGRELRMRESGGRLFRFRFIAGCLATLVAATALAADPDTFLSGSSKDCTACDLSGRDLKERNFQRSRLDRALLRNADLTGASLFRS